ncbi:hypothetical protein Q4557_08560 [Shewanella sp. 5_MG-2023]|nr:hypothetical protein [Shewanella sp. 5_MG-2023]MDO6640008.1 hypothetical protein [Shewanella sp. 5_MG-2023]
MLTMVIFYNYGHDYSDDAYGKVTEIVHTFSLLYTASYIYLNKWDKFV